MNQTETLTPSEEMDLVKRSHAQVKADLIEGINILQVQERLVLALYYQEELTIAEIAQVLRIPDEVVKEIRDATLRKLMNPVH